MDVRIAALLTGLSAGFTVASLVGCQQGLQSIDLALNAAIESDFSGAGDHKFDFQIFMALMVAVGAVLSCLFFVIFLLKNSRKS